MKLSFKELLVLNEERDSGLKYTDKQVKGNIDRVITILSGNKSAVMTKLAQRYHKLDLSIKKLSEERNQINKDMKETVQGLFDSTDVVYTRVVETCSFTITLAKEGKAIEKVEYDFQKIAEELAKLIPDELQSKVDEIMEAYKKVKITQPKSPALTVDLKEGILDSLSKISKMASSVLKKMMGWALSYDKKLDKLKKIMEVKMKMRDL